ncbi:MAG: CHAP domain-containing protein [Rhodovarius sp.]|nr:CHAP domain-containing protein [Rhodovarius sp.]MDW8314323.1 CHAP domain-containing protein [Rhodovarius sp.]
MRHLMLSLGLCAGVILALNATPAQADRVGGSEPARPSLSRSPGQQSGFISCVPYARAVTGMAISGNGRDWWHNAAGRYARSQRPEVGSVLAFPASGGMRAGHVAVVSRVINSRHIEIDHANWAGPGIRRGTVMRGVSVIDVSPDNSWRQVRVQVGHDPTLFGRPYPTYGFIHNRPAGSEYLAQQEAPTRPALVPVVWHGPAPGISPALPHRPAASPARPARPPQAQAAAARPRQAPAAAQSAQRPATRPAATQHAAAR